MQNTVLNFEANLLGISDNFGLTAQTTTPAVFP